MRGWGIAPSVLGMIVATVLRAQAAPVCDTATDTQLDQAIATEPSRLLAKLEGDSLAVFLGKMVASQFMTGTLTMVDELYIVTTKDGGNVLLMFFSDHCLIRTIPASKTVIQAML